MEAATHLLEVLNMAKNSSRLVKHNYSKASDLTDTIIEVEGEKLHVSKTVLMMASPVFKDMFSNVANEDATTRAGTLSNKKLQAVVWMLDYLFPDVSLLITEEKAVALLPLADEYKLTELKKLCNEELMKMGEYRLEIVNLAQKHGSKELLDRAIDQCAKTIRSTSAAHIGTSMKEQLQRPENADINKDCLISIYTKKLSLVSNLAVYEGEDHEVYYF